MRRTGLLVLAAAVVFAALAAANVEELSVAQIEDELQVSYHFATGGWPESLNIDRNARWWKHSTNINGLLCLKLPV